MASNTDKHRTLRLVSLLVLMTAGAVRPFQPRAPLPPSRRCPSAAAPDGTRLQSSTTGKNGKTKFGERTDADVSRFLTDFRTADGKVVDPYKLLRLPRDATRADIKRSYRRLSRKLHPDMAARSEVLPGNCANLDEVREEWERVKFSYEILIDPKTRKSYDRNSRVAEALDDPGAAVGKAVVEGAWSGLGMVLGGAWKLGEVVVDAASGKKG